MALQLAGGGAQVALLARSTAQLEEAAETVRAAGGIAVVVPADLADPNATGEAAVTAAKELGPVDILVNNAAVVGPVGPTVTAGSLAWSSAFAVNVNAPVRLTLALLPSMLDRGWGRIVNVSSGIVDHPGAAVGLNAYAATKGSARSSRLQPGCRAGRQRGDGQRLPARLGRHGHAGVDSQPGTREDRRRPAPPLPGLVRTGCPDHARGLRTVPPHPTRGRSHRRDMERDRCLT